MSYRVQVVGAGHSRATGAATVGVLSEQVYLDGRAANVRVRQLLSSPRWTPDSTVVRVLGDGDYLLGQWVISKGQWCHQGGPWKSGVPNCTGVMPPKPVYPSAPYLGAPPHPGRYSWWGW